MSKKVLVATEKPFSPAAVEQLTEVFKAANYDVQLLESYTDKAELLAAVVDVDAMIIRSDKVTAEVLDAAEQLKIVVRAGAGYDNIDCADAADKGVVAMNTPGQNSNAVAELAFGISHASLFTGLLPVTHQATQENLRLDAELDTLAELGALASIDPAARAAGHARDEVAAVRALTDEIEAGLREVTLNYPSVDEVPLVERVSEVLATSEKGQARQYGAKDPTIRCVGTKIIVTRKLTLEGKDYKRGDFLTIDKQKDWILVSSWD